MAQAMFEAGDAGAVKARRVPFFIEFYRSAIGKKYVMAISGMGMVLFALGHMIGNLKMYQSAEAHNGYGEFLRRLLYPIVPKYGFLWLTRIGLLAFVLVHMHAAYSLTMMNRRARSVGYQSPRHYQAANFASRSMRISGIVVLLYIVWHLADLTWGWVNPDFVYGKAYENTVASLNNPIVAAFYIIANLALGVHLLHGTWSFFQTVGWNNPRFNKWRNLFGYGITAAIVLGNISFPLAIQLDIVG
jgi:succinate dehydrogenase / fumarate reductase, cytochrome b subunit